MTAPGMIGVLVGVAWKLCSSMRVEDVTDTFNWALASSGCATAHVRHRPRLLSDNGPSYSADDLASWFKDQNTGHIRGAQVIPKPSVKSTTGTRRRKTEFS